MYIKLVDKKQLINALRALTDTKIQIIFKDNDRNIYLKDTNTEVITKGVI